MYLKQIPYMIILLLKRKLQLEQDLIVDSPHCLSYNFYDVSLEIFILDQLIIPLIHIFLYSHHLSA